MKTLVINEVKLAEEVLIQYKGFNFSVKSHNEGQYGFERRVRISIIKENLERFRLQIVGIVRLFSEGNDLRTKDKYIKQSENLGSLIIGQTNFEDCLEESKKFIKKYIDFINLDN